MAKQFLCSLDAPIVETVSGKVRGFQVDGTYTCLLYTSDAADE